MAIKPDATSRRLVRRLASSRPILQPPHYRAQVGKIIQRFEEKGFTLAGLKLLRPTAELAAQYAPKQLNGRGSAAAVRTPCGRHYAEHNGRHFFPKLVRFLASGPVVAMVPLGCARCPSLSSDCLKTTMRA